MAKVSTTKDDGSDARDAAYGCQSLRPDEAFGAFLAAVTRANTIYDEAGVL